MNQGPVDEAELKKRILADEQFLADVLRLRRGGREARWWESAPLMSAIVMIVSIVFGVGATMLTNRDAKLREHELSLLQAQRAERLAVLANLHKVIASVIRGTQDRLQVAKGELDRLPDTRMDSILRNADAIDGEWRTLKESNEFLIPYHFAGLGRVDSAWYAARDSLQQFVTCVEKAYRKYNGSSAPDTTCVESGERARVGIREMWVAINRAPH